MVPGEALAVGRRALDGRATSRKLGAVGYETRLEGTLALHPLPDAPEVAALREALASLSNPRAGRLDLTPLGRALEISDTFDWRAAVAAIEEAIALAFTPRGIALSGVVRAVGEDDAPLATITVGARGVEIADVDAGDDGDSTTGWIESLGAADPELREYAATLLGEREAELVTEALATAARTDPVERVRRKALEALGHLGAEAAGALDDLAHCLDDPSPFVRYWATFALGRLGPAAAPTLPALRRMTTDIEDGPRYGAVDAIKRIEEAMSMASEEKETEWAHFRESAGEHGLEAYADALVRLCVPSLRLVPRKRSRLKSRLGGAPDAPLGFPWPRSSTGEPLVFVAQLELAEVRATGLPGALALPERGRLAFFHGYEASPDGVHTGNAGRVFFFEEGVALGPTVAPAHPDVASLPPTPIALELQTEELPPLESPFYALLLGDAGQRDGDPWTRALEVFGDFAAAYGQTGVRDEDARPVHRFLGYADPLQADVYGSTEGNAARVPFEQWTTLEHHRAAARWRLLLQVDSDLSREFCFGDNGVLAFMIREDDLAARRFERVWVEWQSH